MPTQQSEPSEAGQQQWQRRGNRDDPALEGKLALVESRPQLTLAEDANDHILRATDLGQRAVEQGYGRPHEGILTRAERDAKLQERGQRREIELQETGSIAFDRRI